MCTLEQGKSRIHASEDSFFEKKKKARMSVYEVVKIMQGFWKDL